MAATRKESVTIEVRPLDDVDLADIVRIDEMLSGTYRPSVWEQRLVYYLRRDPDASLAAVLDGAVVGFAMGEVRSGEFGLEEPTGWVEVLGVEPAHHGHEVGSRLLEAMVEHFQSRGATTVRTLVDDAMPGLAAFFSARGFEPASLKPFVRRLPREA